MIRWDEIQRIAVVLLLRRCHPALLLDGFANFRPIIHILYSDDVGGGVIEW